MPQPDFRRLFESAADACLVLAPEAPHFTIVAVSDAYLRLTRSAREQVVGRDVFELFPDRSKLQGSLERVVRHHGPDSIVVEHESRFVKTVNRPVFDDGGRLLYILHRVEDVTEWVSQSADARLRTLESVVTTANDAIVITEAGELDEPGPRIIYVNEGFTRMTGYAPDEVIGRSPRILQGPDTDRAARAELRRGLERREPVRVELLNYKKDGTPFWVELMVAPVFDPQGKLLHFAAVQRDMTEHKAGLERIRAILESITEAFFALDADWRFTYVNHVAEEVFGRTRETLLGKTLWEEFPEAWTSRAGQYYRRAREEQKTLHFETSIDGRHFEFHVFPSSEGLAVYANDVTERARAALALSESAARYRSIFDHSMDAVLLTAPDGRIAMANHAATTLFGYSEDELRELGRNAIVDPSDPRLAAALEERRQTGRFRGKLTMKRKDGSRVPVELSSAIFRDERGAEWTSMFIRDISEHEAREAEREQLIAEVDARRRWLEAMLEHVPIGVVMFDAGGRVSVNRRAEEAFGIQLSPSEGNQQYVGRIRYPDGAVVPQDELPSTRALRTGETVLGAEFLLERPDGSRTPILGSAAPIRGADGGMIGVIGVFQDVSERMRAEAAIRARERLLSGVFEILPVGLWIADAQGKFVRSNPASQRIWAGQREGMAELSDYEAWWADTGEPVMPHEWPLARALEGEKSLGAVMRIRALDGSEKTIVNSALPLYDDDGSFAGAIVLNQDISELKQVEESLRRAVCSRDELLGIVAHDLRNPLNGILLQTELLERRHQDSSGASAKAIEVIRRQANRMNRLIQDLLDVTRIEAGALIIERVRVPVEQLLTEVIESQAANASSAGITLRPDLRGQPRDVWGDRERLVQVFDNLIGNALKFTPRGGTVTVGATAHGASTQFFVSDTGSGIPADVLPHIFDRFWQASRKDKRGAGLGLAIAKGIIEGQGGRIRVESKPGSGSTFFFTIPSVQLTEHHELRR